MSLVADGYFYHAVFFVLKDAVRLFYAAEREVVCDEWRSVYLALFYESQHFLAVAAVYAAVLNVRFLPYMSGRGRVCGSS